MIRIALAEDFLQMREAIKSLVNQLPGYSVCLEAANGFELVKELNATKDLPSLALIDVQMPVMDGLAVTNYLTEHSPGIRIIAVSGFCNASIARDILYAGARGYIVKANLKAKTLHQAFKTVCAGDLFIDKEIGDKDSFKSDLLSERCKIVEQAPPDISEKEKTFLQLCTTAASYEQIAQLMNVAKESVYNYQKSLKEKTGLGSRQELMLYAIQYGIAKVARLVNNPGG